MRNHRWTLVGKKALITGGTKGIGLAIAQDFLFLDAEIIIVARNTEALKLLIEDWRSQGCKAHGVVADVATSDGRQVIFEEVRKTFGTLDILVNNVGTNIRKKSSEYTEDEYRFIFETNLTSVFEICRLAYPLLKGKDDSSIVNIGSVAGQTSVHTGAPYAMTKAALEQLTRYLAVEWASDRIRVNTVAPWFIHTPLTEPYLSNPDVSTSVISRTPNQRIGEPEEVSGIVAFLCMPTATHITGQCIAVDGGFLSFGF